MDPNTLSPIRLPRRLAAAIFACCMLSGVSGCTSAPAAAPPPVQIMIAFRAPVDGAAPELLSRLERLAGVSIRYAAPVSQTLHAYQLRCPASDPGCDTAIRLLRTDPAVQNISSNSLRKPFSEIR